VFVIAGVELGLITTAGITRYIHKATTVRIRSVIMVAVTYTSTQKLL